MPNLKRYGLMMNALGLKNIRLNAGFIQNVCIKHSALINELVNVTPCRTEGNPRVSDNGKSDMILWPWDITDD